jgi:hypothetical protein
MRGGREMKDYPFVVNTSNGSMHMFDTLEHAIDYAETLYNRSAVSVYVSRIGDDEILYTLEY